MAAYSQDLRDRVLRGLERGEGATSIANRLEVSLRWVYHVKDRYEKEGGAGGAEVGRVSPFARGGDGAAYSSVDRRAG
jgi:transposase